MDGGVGISAAVAIAAKFIEPSKFTSRHSACYDQEAEKSLKTAERFEKIPKEDVDYFEAEEYNALHSKSLGDLSTYRSAQDEYKEKKWHRGPKAKLDSRKNVREAKRCVQRSIFQEYAHVDELETYSRAASSRGSSVASFASGGSSSGLDLDRSRKYRTDSLSIRATGHSPPFASLEDIRNDETRDVARDHISAWLSSVPMTSEEQDEPSTSMLEENKPNPTPRRPTLSPSAAQADDIAYRFYHKVTLLLIDARASHSQKGHSSKRDTQFQFDTPSSELFRDNLQIYKSIFVSILPPFQLHVLLTIPELTLGQVLVFLSPTGQRIRLYPTPKHILLESWSLVFTPSLTLAYINLPTMYKSCISLFEGVHRLLRDLPAWKLYGKLGRSGTNSILEMSLSMGTSEPAPDVLHFDACPSPIAQPFLTTIQSFDSILHRNGTLTLMVQYLTSPNFQLHNGESLLSSQPFSLGGNGDEGAFPFVPPEPRSLSASPFPQWHPLYQGAPLLFPEHYVDPFIPRSPCSGSGSMPSTTSFSSTNAYDDDISAFVQDVVSMRPLGTRSGQAGVEREGTVVRERARASRGEEGSSAVREEGEMLAMEGVADRRLKEMNDAFLKSLESLGARGVGGE